MPRKANSGGGLNTDAPLRDLDSLRLPTDLLGSTVMTANLAKVRCEKPGNQTFIRSHPDLYAHYLMFERREEAGTRHYLVSPEVSEMEEDARPILLQAYIARNGAISLRLLSVSRSSCKVLSKAGCALTISRKVCPLRSSLFVWVVGHNNPCRWTKSRKRSCLKTPST